MLLVEILKINHFDVLAPFYDRLFKVKDIEKIKDITALPTTGILLDVGGGTGRISKVLKHSIDHVIVTDLSYAMLSQIELSIGISTACMKSEYLAFPNDHFDRVIIVDALHHVYRASETCRELFRVVKPGGRIVIEEPDISVFAVKILSLVEKLLLMRSLFIRPEKIADYFNFSNADVSIQRNGHTAWIVVDKVRSYAVQGGANPPTA